LERRVTLKLLIPNHDPSVTDLKSITYESPTHIPGETISRLFSLVGWIKPRREKPDVHVKIDAISNHTLYLDGTADDFEFLEATFRNSTALYSARHDNEIVGFVRVLSDSLQRSILYDLVVHPEYQHRGIGTKLLERCLKDFAHTQITLGTSSTTMKFYEKFGFTKSQNYMEVTTKAY
jgi:ribosomal protein S18 acetylase RimI-like enzyme